MKKKTVSITRDVWTETQSKQLNVLPQIEIATMQPRPFWAVNVDATRVVVDAPMVVVVVVVVMDVIMMTVDVMIVANVSRRVIMTIVQQQ